MLSALTWSLRSLFGNPSSHPPQHLLDESHIDRHVALQTPAKTAIGELGPMGGRSAIESLPEDLLQHVFQTYLDALNPTSTARNGIKYSHDRLRAPFLLSSVCRSWRTCALASSILWTYIVMPALVYEPRTRHVSHHIKQQLKQFSKRWIELIGRLLARSGQAGLHIVIPDLDVTRLQPNVAHEFELHRKIMLALAPHYARILSLRMSTDGAALSLIWEILGTPRGGVDGTLNLHTVQLQYIELKIRHSVSGQTYYPVVHLHAPRLRVCRIERATCLRLEQSHLVRLEVSVEPETSSTWTQILYVSVTTLEYLHLLISYFPDGSEPPLPAFKQSHSKTVFPSLIHFGITATFYKPKKILSEIFTIISAPALRSIQFAPTSNHLPSGPVFLQFARYLSDPVNGTVERFYLSRAVDGAMLDIGDARSIARHLPSVKVLTLQSGSDVAVGFIGAMHHLAPQVQICIESVKVRLPIGSPQERLTVAVETSTTEQRLAFFDVTSAARDYDNVPKTEDVFPQKRCIFQYIENAVIVWKDGPFARSEEDEEHPLGPRYRIIPTRMFTSADPTTIAEFVY